MWTYLIPTGELFDHVGHCVGVGYAGNGDGKNNVAMCDVKGVGPIPVGRYHIDLHLFDHPRCGKDCLRLTPLVGNQMFGRDGFLIHGDKIGAPGTASDGCPVQPHNTRLLIASSSDNLLDVVAELPQQVCDPEDSV